MELEQLMSYCKSKKGVQETYPFGDAPICMKVCGKIFAEIYPGADNCKITLKCDPALAQMYRNQYPGIVVRGYHCPPVQQPYRNTVLIPGMEESLLLDMIDHSYQEVLKGFSQKARLDFLGAVTKEELLKRGAIVLERIEEGFEGCEWNLLTGERQELFTQLRCLWEEAGKENAYVDFYYGSLKKESKDFVWDTLSDRGRILLEPYRFIRKAVYLPLEEDLLELTLELNEKEILFSTYYFLKQPCTVWGNYEKKYPVFHRKNR